MNTNPAAHNRNEISSLENTAATHPALRIFAGIISYVFHPLFIPVYIALFLVNMHPYLFPGFSSWVKLTIVLQVAVNCTLLPLVSILLLRALKFIDSVYMKTSRERIIPYAITMIFYFWNWYVFKNNNQPAPVVAFSLAIFITSIAGFIANIYIKISMHTMAVGVLGAFFAIMAFEESMNYTFYLACALLIAGLVGTARLLVSNHEPKEIYAGYLVGILSQVIAFFIVF